MPPTVVVDTGPIVALLDADEAHHEWAREQFQTFAAPLLTCETVLSEASFLLARAGEDPSLPVTLVERGVLKVTRTLSSPEDVLAVGRMIRRYRNVPMSLADACLFVDGHRNRPDQQGQRPLQRGVGMAPERSLVEAEPDNHHLVRRHDDRALAAGALHAERAVRQ